MESVLTAKTIINVAAVAGSLSRTSKNRGLIRAAIELTKQSIDGMSIQDVDISQLPILNTDLYSNGKYPRVVEAFRDKIKQSDCFFFASPEYNYSVTPALKNAIDWGSLEPNVWEDKAAAIVSTGYDFGGGRAQYVLRKSGVKLNIHFINQPEFFLNDYPPKFDEEGNLTDPETKEKLKTILLALKDFTLRLQPK